MATIKIGDCIESMRCMDAGSVHCCVTSPPYWGLRDYGNDGQIGLEDTPEAYVARLVDVFREVRRVLRDDGSVWLNLGDSYASNPASGGAGQQDGGDHQRTPDRGYQRPQNLKPKDLVGIPWRVAFALQADGWYLRSDIIWHEPNPMPESVTDRPTKAHEYVFLLTKSARYFWDADAVRESWADARAGDSGAKRDTVDRSALRNDGGRTNAPTTTGRNRRSVWTIATRPFSGAHFAVMPPALVEPCVLAGCPVGGTVLDPFGGSGTVAVVALQHHRQAIICELSPDYAEIARQRIASEGRPAMRGKIPRPPKADERQGALL